MDFSRLSSIREDNDLKQSDMARILNVEQSNISRWENNKEIIPLDKKYIDNNIKSFKNDKKITQTELADFLNTSHSTISAYESGNTLILTAFAYQICKKYNISLDWLCGRSKIMNLSKN